MNFQTRFCPNVESISIRPETSSTRILPLKNSKVFSTFLLYYHILKLFCTSPKKVRGVLWFMTSTCKAHITPYNNERRLSLSKFPFVKDDNISLKEELICYIVTWKLKANSSKNPYIKFNLLLQNDHIFCWQWSHYKNL